MLASTAFRDVVGRKLYGHGAPLRKTFALACAGAPKTGRELPSFSFGTSIVGGPGEAWKEPAAALPFLVTAIPTPMDTVWLLYP
jgi:hypothetical protein